MLSHNSSYIQFITYTQFQSQFHDPNIIIYHANPVKSCPKYKQIIQKCFSQHGGGGKTP